MLDGKGFLSGCNLIFGLTHFFSVTACGCSVTRKFEFFIFHACVIVRMCKKNNAKLMSKVRDASN